MLSKTLQYVGKDEESYTFYAYYTDTTGGIEWELWQCPPGAPSTSLQPLAYGLKSSKPKAMASVRWHVKYYGGRFSRAQSKDLVITRP